jgi:hypothetical protein
MHTPQEIFDNAKCNESLDIDAAFGDFMLFYPRVERFPRFEMRVQMEQICKRYWLIA